MQIHHPDSSLPLRRFSTDLRPFVAIIALVTLGACADPHVANDSEDGPVRHTCSERSAGPGQNTTSLEKDRVHTALGLDWGKDFVEFETNQSVQLQYGSQAGMGLPAVLRLSDADMAKVTRVDMSLIVDQAPIGTLRIVEPVVVCSDQQGLLDAMLMIDVTGHPTVASVAQLDGRAAFIDYQIFSSSEVIHQDVLAIQLAL